MRAGTRNTRLGRIQKFYCRTCRRHFCPSSIPRRQYSAATILCAVTSYNLGRTLEETRAHVSRHARVKVPTSTIHAWIGQFAAVCTFTKIRKRFSLSPDETIQANTFDHKQEYRFAFHRFKANILCKRPFSTRARICGTSWSIARMSCFKGVMALEPRTAIYRT
jgi:transposase-like protein